MNTKFKTTVKCSGCVDSVKPFLNEAAGDGNWTVDLQTPEKILTISSDVDKQKIIDAMAKGGYKAEALG